MPTDEQYRDAARDIVAENISVPDTSNIERDTGGAWVTVWIWISDKDIKDSNESGQFGVGA